MYASRHREKRVLGDFLFGDGFIIENQKEFAS